MKHIITHLLLIVSLGITAQTTSIPDAQFEQELIDLGIDSDSSLNGQLLTSDALAVTSLTLDYVGSDTEQYIEDLTGLEAFTNLESLTVNGTMVEQLQVSTLVNLKQLNCVDNRLTDIDVSNNTQLEYLDITSGGDVMPFNDFSVIDVSNNPNLHTLIAPGVNKINLSNNANQEEMFIDISCRWCVGYPSNYIEDTVCIEVDEAQQAQNNQYPYSEWTIQHQYMAYNFTDDVEVCSLNLTPFKESKLSIYPNPVKEQFYIDSKLPLQQVEVYSLSGQLVKRYAVASTYVVSDLASGLYLVKITSGDNTFTQKLKVE